MIKHTLGTKPDPHLLQMYTLYLTVRCCSRRCGTAFAVALLLGAVFAAYHAGQHSGSGHPQVRGQL